MRAPPVAASRARPSPRAEPRWASRTSFRSSARQLAQSLDRSGGEHLNRRRTRASSAAIRIDARRSSARAAVARAHEPSPRGSSTTNELVPAKRWFCQFGRRARGPAACGRNGIAGQRARSGAPTARSAPGADERRRCVLVEPDRQVRPEAADRAGAASPRLGLRERARARSIRRRRGAPSGRQSKGKLRLRSTPWALPRVPAATPSGLRVGTTQSVGVAGRGGRRSAGGRPAFRRSRRRGCSRRRAPLRRARCRRRWSQGGSAVPSPSGRQSISFRPEPGWPLRSRRRERRHGRLAGGAGGRRAAADATGADRRPRARCIARRLRRLAVSRRGPRRSRRSMLAIGLPPSARFVQLGSGQL